jgi:hypothetical protein
MNKHNDTSPCRDERDDPSCFVLELWGIRYQVKQIVERSIAFYTEKLVLFLSLFFLGFKLDH